MEMRQAKEDGSCERIDNNQMKQIVCYKCDNEFPEEDAETHNGKPFCPICMDEYENYFR